MNLDRIGIDCPLYESDCSDSEFDIGEFCALSPNNGKLTLTHNGVSIGDFTANQQEDETINIVTPTSEDITNAVAGEALLREQADNTLQSNINAEQLARERADRDIQSVLDGESLARSNADNELQSQIDAIASKSDVVDVVANYAALQAYDTSKLNDNDVVKVLDDETHGDTMTYYRWNKSTSTWSYIGQEAAYYSKSQMDTLLATKQDNLTAGTGIDITGATISADTSVLATKSELANYAEKSDTYTKTEVDNLVEPKLSVEVVENLPATGEENKLYLTEKAKTIQTATGNPITATITDGAGNLSDFRLDGDTYQQSYTGKNLSPNIGTLQWSSNNITNVVITSNESTFTLSTTANFSGVYLNKTLNDSICPYYYLTGYVVSFEISASETTNFTIGQSGGTQTQYSVGTTPIRISTTSGNANFVIYATSKNGANVSIKNIQVEVGSTPTSYEPYVGGIPAPNPDYPQAIQTVTGEQTVTINSTDYPINLGNIELCKLGTYQDYIYKDGSDWKVHKAMSKVLIDGKTGTISNPSTNRFNLDNLIADYKRQANSSFALCDQYISLGQTDNNAQFNASASGYECCINFGSATASVIRFKNTKITTSDDFADALEANPLIMYYVLATATDTIITDSTLIAQLEAIRTASLENGSNTLSNSATGSNLAGDMEISYYGYNPTNRYDKWLWLDINNSYEQLGS